MKTLLFGIALFACHTTCMAAAAMSNAQATKLGISTSKPIADDTLTSGSILGQVQTAPQATQLIARPFGVQVLKWHVSIGQVVQQNAPLLTAFSPVLLELEHQLHNAIATQKLTQQRLQRDSQLFKEGIAPRKQLENSQAEAMQATETVDGLLNQIAQMGLSDKELKKLKALQHLEGQFTIQATSTGKVSALHVSPGQAIAPNTTLVTLIQSEDLMIEIPMPPAQAAQLTIGQQLYLEDNTPIRIEAIKHQLSDAQKTIVLCSAQHNQLRAGQWIRINLPNLSRNHAWRISRNALTHIHNQPHIFVKTDTDIEAIPVTLIRATRDGWVVYAEQLNAEQHIVVTGTAAAKGFIEAAP